MVLNAPARPGPAAATDGAAGLADGDADSATALRDASVHKVRRTMLTTHANSGVLKTLQETAGHASLSTTATYLHKSDR